LNTVNIEIIGRKRIYARDPTIYALLIPNSAISWHAERAIYFALGTTYSTIGFFVVPLLLWFSQISISNISCSSGFFTQVPSCAFAKASFNWVLASYSRKKKTKYAI